MLKNIAAEVESAVVNIATRAELRMLAVVVLGKALTPRITVPKES